MRSLERGLEGGPPGSTRKRDKIFFFQTGNSGMYQRFPFRLRRTSVQDSSRPEVFEHASICSPAWELEFISTIAQFLNTLRSVRLHITHRTHRSVRLHASICSPAWELEFISTIAQFLSSLRSVRLHRKPSTVSFDFRLQWERKRIIGSLGQLWNALTSAPGAKNELLNGGLSSRFFFFPSFVYQVKT